jgi:hypothetical protein
MHDKIIFFYHFGDALKFKIINFFFLGTTSGILCKTIFKTLDI